MVVPSGGAAFGSERCCRGSCFSAIAEQLDGRFPQWKVEMVELFMPLRYLLSGCVGCVSCSRLHVRRDQGDGESHAGRRDVRAHRRETPLISSRTACSARGLSSRATSELSTAVRQRQSQSRSSSATGMSMIGMSGNQIRAVSAGHNPIAPTTSSCRTASPANSPWSARFSGPN